MFLQKKRVRYTKYLNKLSDDGQTTEKFIQSKPLVDIEDTELQKEQTNANLLFMQEFLVANKEKTWKDKSNYCPNSIQPIQLLETLVAESISKEKVLEPYWNKCSKEMSTKLWLPLETDLQDLDTSFLNGFSRNLEQLSWQSTMRKTGHPKKNSQKICWQSQLFSQPDTTVEENIKFCRKIRIYPDKEQRLYFNKCFGTTRYMYNKTVEYIEKMYKEKQKLTEQAKDGCTYKFVKGQRKGMCCKQSIDGALKFFCKKHKNKLVECNVKFNLPHLRSKIMKRDRDLNEDEFWIKDVPYDTRQLAIKESIQAYKSVFTLLRNKHIDKFDMKFKSKKQPTQMFNIDKRALKLNLKLFGKKLTKSLRVRKRMKKWWSKNIKNIDSNCVIVREKPGIYYLCIPQEKKQITNTAKYNTVSLDPGIRSFQVFYSSEGVYGKIGDGTVDELTNIAKKVDLLTSLKSNKHGRTKRNINQRCFKLRTKIKNIVKDLHWKTASYLCKTFENIIIPTFNVSNMVTRLPYKARKINNKTVRNLLYLSHGKFMEILKYKASCYTNRNVHVCSEAFTSKTCGKCGFIDKKLGGKKMYECKNCDYVLDRDVHGARNIFLRTMSYQK